MPSPMTTEWGTDDLCLWIRLLEGGHVFDIRYVGLESKPGDTADIQGRMKAWRMIKGITCMSVSQVRKDKTWIPNSYGYGKDVIRQSI